MLILYYFCAVYLFLVNFKEDIAVTDVPAPLKKMYKKFVKAIKGDDNFGELLCHHSACPVLQVMLITLSKTDSEQFAELTQMVIRKGRIPLTENPAAADDDEEDEETINRYLLTVETTNRVGFMNIW